MQMVDIIRERFEEILEPLGIEFVESGLQSMKWTCKGAISDYMQIQIRKSYRCEILLNQEDYKDLCETSFGEGTLFYGLKHLLNVTNIEANEDDEDKNRIRITFETNPQLIGGC